MDPIEATHAVGLPLKLLGGAMGRITSAEQDRGCFVVGLWSGNLPTGSMTIPFDRVQPLRPGCRALIETTETA
ncbi:hypothetical protein TSO5_04315 [Azospirillum sp. TSO5]|nr:hypothetical protein TSO5_04315 [Azospirillum sp. TSO5]